MADHVRSRWRDIFAATEIRTLRNALIFAVAGENPAHGGMIRNTVRYQTLTNVGSSRRP
jgi:hypothetical protein